MCSVTQYLVFSIRYSVFRGGPTKSLGILLGLVFSVTRYSAFSIWFSVFRREGANSVTQYSVFGTRCFVFPEGGGPVCFRNSLFGIQPQMPTRFLALRLASLSAPQTVVSRSLCVLQQPCSTSPSSLAMAYPAWPKGQPPLEPCGFPHQDWSTTFNNVPRFGCTLQAALPCGGIDAFGHFCNQLAIDWYPRQASR